MSEPQGCLKDLELQALVDGSLPEEKLASSAAHLETCQDCRQRLQLLAGESSAIPPEGGSDPGSAAPSEALKEAMRNLKADVGVTAETLPASSTGLSSLRFLGPSANPRHLGRLGGYEILELIGRGGMGTVLKARDSKLERLVAIKVLNPDLATNDAARARFLREAQSAAAVIHEHVVTIHAVEDSGEVPFLVMEYIVGVSLEDRIQRSGHLRLEEILRIGRQTASGLAAAHAQGLVHRDIKPANILLEDGVERVKITDFGLARVIHDACLLETSEAVGTPQYMSPEQARGGPIDHRSDLFSLGCVLYAMCAGRSPFRAETPDEAIRRVREDAPRPIREVNPDVPDWLAAIIDRLLAKKPEDRFQTAGEVAEVLAQHLAQVQQPTQVRFTAGAAGPETGRKGRPASRFRIILGAAAIVCVGLGLWGVLERNGITNVWTARGLPSGKGATGEHPADSRPAAPPSPPPGAAAKLDADKQAAVDAREREFRKLVNRRAGKPYALANQYAVAGEWRLAAEEVARVKKDAPISSENYRALAVAQLMAGDTDGYKVTCANAVRELSGLGPVTKAYLVQLCCLAPYSGIGRNTLTRMIKDANPRSVSEATLDPALAFFLFRSGRDEEVLSIHLEQGRSERVFWIVILQAMAKQRLGRTEEAKVTLDEVSREIDRVFPRPTGPAEQLTLTHWVRWATLQILLREARQMIAPEKTP